MSFSIVNASLPSLEAELNETPQDLDPKNECIKQLSQKSLKSLCAPLSHPVPSHAKRLPALSNTVKKYLESSTNASPQKRLKCFNHLYNSIFYNNGSFDWNNIVQKLESLKPLLPDLLKTLSEQFKQQDNEQAFAKHVMDFFSVYSYFLYDAQELPLEPAFYPSPSLLIQEAQNTSSPYFQSSVTALSNLCYADLDICKEASSPVLSTLLKYYPNASSTEKPAVSELLVNLSAYKTPENARLMAQSKLFEDFLTPLPSNYFTQDSFFICQICLVNNVLYSLPREEQLKFVNINWIDSLAKQCSFSYNKSYYTNLLSYLASLSPAFRTKVLQTQLIKANDITDVLKPRARSSFSSQQK